MTIVEGDIDNVVAKINELSKEKIADGRNVAVIATDETKYRYKYGTVKSTVQEKLKVPLQQGYMIY